MSLLKKLYTKIFNITESKRIYDKRVEIRVTKEEKELFRKYADLKRTDLSKLTRNLLHQEINSFIKQADIQI